MGERLGSGDGERKTLLTRQIASEPLPASVLLGAFIWWSSVSDMVQRERGRIRFGSETPSGK